MDEDHIVAVDPTITLLTDWVEGRNELYLQIANLIPEQDRRYVIISMLANEYAFFGMMSRLHTQHIRNTTSTTYVTLNIPNPNNTPGFMDAVPVVATPEQIEAAVIRDDTSSATPIVCAICQESVESSFSRIRRCGHIYHETCLTMWLQTSVRCPVCRHDIRETGQPAETSAAVTQTSSQSVIP
jgi:hypothetical protein